MVGEAPLGVGERHLEEVGEVDVELGEVRAGRDETVEEPVRLRTEMILQSVLRSHHSAPAGENQQSLGRQSSQSRQAEERGLGCVLAVLGSSERSEIKEIRHQRQGRDQVLYLD